VAPLEIGDHNHHGAVGGLDEIVEHPLDEVSALEGLPHEGAYGDPAEGLEAVLVCPRVTLDETQRDEGPQEPQHGGLVKGYLLRQFGQSLPFGGDEQCLEQPRCPVY